LVLVFGVLGGTGDLDKLIVELSEGVIGEGVGVLDLALLGD